MQTRSLGNAMNSRNISFATLAVCAVLAMPLGAEEAQPGMPSLGWMLNAQRSEIWRLDGVPGTLRMSSEALEEAEQSWLSRELLLQQRGETLVVRELRSGTRRVEAWPAGAAVAFSADGKRFVPYTVEEGEPWVGNDGRTKRWEGAQAYAERGGLVAVGQGSGEIVIWQEQGGEWQEQRRLAPPVQGGWRAMHWSGETFYLLTRDGDLYAWREGEAEAQLLASEVRQFRALASEGFFVLERGAGPQLLYPGSLGQKLYSLPGSKAVVSEGVAQ